MGMTRIAPTCSQTHQLRWCRSCVADALTNPPHDMCVRRPSSGRQQEALTTTTCQSHARTRVALSYSLKGFYTALSHTAAEGSATMGTEENLPLEQSGPSMGAMLGGAPRPVPHTTKGLQTLYAAGMILSLLGLWGTDYCKGSLPASWMLDKSRGYIPIRGPRPLAEA